MNLQQELQRFKMELLRKQPFYGDIVMRLEFEENRNIATAATNGKKIMYNPDFLKAQSPGQRNYILMHEVLHVLLLHCTRGRDRDPQLWNVAIDYIVNDMLDTKMARPMKQAGIPLERPASGLFATLSYNETADNLYGAIVKDNRSRMHKGKLNGSMLTVRKDYRRPNTATITINLPAPESGAPGGDLIPGNLTPEQQENLENELQKIIADAIRGEKQRGELGSCFIPDDIYRLAESKRLNWKALLKNMLWETQSDESSYATPERKYLHMDMILPGHGESEETLEEVWAFVDCSGSVGKDEMEQFLTQLYRLLKEFRCTMHLAYWDTSVQDVYRDIKSEKKLLECIPHHFGGTDINCVYQWLRENRIRPDCMLVLTDGYFGTLREDNSRLRRKTIVVLSEKSAPVNDNITRVGKVASL